MRCVLVATLAAGALAADVFEQEVLAAPATHKRISEVDRSFESGLKDLITTPRPSELIDETELPLNFDWSNLEGRSYTPSAQPASPVLRLVLVRGGAAAAPSPRPPRPRAAARRVPRSRRRAAAAAVPRSERSSRRRLVFLARDQGARHDVLARGPHQDRARGAESRVRTSTSRSSRSSTAAGAPRAAARAAARSPRTRTCTTRAASRTTRASSTARSTATARTRAGARRAAASATAGR